MKLYLPKGSNMTEAEKKEWINNVKSLTASFHNKKVPVNYALDIDAYMRMRQKSNYKRFITEMWQENYDWAEKLCLECNPDFLQDDLLRYAFFLTAGGKWQKIQLPYLESKWDREKLKTLLREDHMLQPDITSAEYQTSETMINHLTHLTVFQEKMGVKIDSLKTIVEFGGGYGGMCRLFRRISGSNTHIIIDLPIFIIIQAYYLKNIFGNTQVNLIVNEDNDIEPGKINLVEISGEKHLDAISTLAPDLFLATWSLSEANEYTQKKIYGRKYFDAKHILAGYRHYESPNPRQPCSDSIKLTPDYEIVYEGNTFFALAHEQNYLFARKK